ncbi:hypothetical protein KKF61_03625 [Patescibacteria group bacterium]|nr:hypothetical protein [Patescibacteria group bacterium]MBU0964464.1 hypothetical protein [Patescibacteria group bacterium]
MYWANFFHIYQPPNWPLKIILKVAHESYRPILKTLEKNKKLRITLNISGSLTEQLVEHKLTDIVKRIKILAFKKQIELTGTACYHPILPLIPAKEAIRQIKLNDYINKKYFGRAYRPKGFFPPEMGYSPELAKIVNRLKYQWIIMDEIAAYGKLEKINFNHKYIIKGVGLKAVFRNRAVSDYFSFHSQANHPEKFWEFVHKEKRSSEYLITAMDGENLGHHRLGFDKFWTELATEKNVKTLTISELLNKYQTKETVNPKKSSWSSRNFEVNKNNPYILWQGANNSIHHLQWKLLNEVIQLVNKNKQHFNYYKARALLDRRLASDQFWWASAKPWWSLAIIKKKTKEILYLASLLEKNIQPIASIADSIIRQSKKWQQTNKFKTIADNYLASQKEIRYIGGKKINF